MSVEMDPDAALMLKVKEGDHEAFAALVEKYRQPVMNLVFSMLRDATEAEDVAQNVFVRAHRAAPTYRVSSKFVTWLFAIARNVCLNEIRRRSRHPAESMDATHPEQEDAPWHQFKDKEAYTPGEQVLHRELEEKIAEALAELPENHRVALLLCRQDELSYEDIAKVLGCSTSATKSLIHRARETLKERLKTYLRTGAWRNEK